MPAAAQNSGEEESPHAAAFSALGIDPALAATAARLGWTAPTDVQREAIPHALAGRDVIGLAQTGSGKTAAFALPILHALLQARHAIFAVVLAPTRELAIQIAEQFNALGSDIGVKTAVLVGGVDMMAQALALAKRPHVVVGTPGRVVDHLTNTKGFHMKTVRYLVLDEADRLLNLDFEAELDEILRAIPREQRRSLMFSATMTSKVAKLQRACLTNPVKVEVSTKYSTVDKLRQQYLFVPAKSKECYLAYLCNELTGKSMIVFLRTCDGCRRAALMLRALGFEAVPLHGQLAQPKRLAALQRFKAGTRSILVATDVASRGLDLPSVDVVVNFDVSPNPKDYIHRVGRTARAGRSGIAITIVSQYDVEFFQKVEAAIGMKLDQYPAPEEQVMILQGAVSDAQRAANTAMREQDSKRKGARRRGGDLQDSYEDDVEALGSQAAAEILQGKRKKKKNY